MDFVFLDYVLDDIYFHSRRDNYVYDSSCNDITLL